MQRAKTQKEIDNERYVKKYVDTRKASRDDDEEDDDEDEWSEDRGSADKDDTSSKHEDDMESASSLTQDDASEDNGSAARSNGTDGVSHAAQSGYQPKRRNNNEPTVYKRLGRSMYSAMEIHGFFGLIDTNEVRQGARILTVHIPSRSTSYSFDIKDGDTIYANGLTRKGKGKHAALHVIYSTLHQYYAPGRKVTSCTIGVPNEEWVHFMHET